MCLYILPFFSMLALVLIIFLSDPITNFEPMPQNKLILYFLVIVCLILLQVTNCCSYTLTATALDRANAEEALLPIPKVFDSHEKEKAFQNSLDKDVIDDFHRSSKDDSVEIEGINMIFS